MISVDSIYNYWPIIWAFIIYILRTCIDLFVFRSGFDTTIIAEKSKNLGVDLYWIGIMIWGGIIISENKHVRFVEIFKNNPPFMV